MANCLWPHGWQHTGHPCPSPIPGVCSNSCLSSGDAIQPSHPLLSLSCPAFSLSQIQGLLQWVNSSGGQSTGASVSASILAMNIQDWFPLGLIDWISLQSKGLSRDFSNTTVQKLQLFGTQFSLWSKSHIHMTTGKTIALNKWTFVNKEMSLLFNMLSRLVIAFLLRSKYLLISCCSQHLQWFWSQKK